MLCGWNIIHCLLSDANPSATNTDTAANPDARAAYGNANTHSHSHSHSHTYTRTAYVNSDSDPHTNTNTDAYDESMVPHDSQRLARDARHHHAARLGR